MKLKKKYVIEAQRFLNEAQFTLTLDGLAGKKTVDAAKTTLHWLEIDIKTNADPVVAILQYKIKTKVDGFFGPATAAAFDEYFKNSFDREAVDARIDEDDINRTIVKTNPHGWPESYDDIVNVFGEPGDTDNLTTITLPYPMRLAWDKTVVVNKVRCHKMIAEPLLEVFKEIKEHYTLDELKDLGLDLFGGIYNLRRMRGGSKYSTHSWAISIDINPSKNSLRKKWDDSAMSDPRCTKFIQAFYNQGFINLGLEKNYDSMHFEAIASVK